MRKLRLSDVQSAVAGVIDTCATDSRVTDTVNQVVERLMSMGNWTGTVGRYRICATDGCITWPREIASILAWAKDDCPGIIRNQWYEFLGDGPGQLDADDDDADQLIDRGQHCCFDDVSTTGKKLKLIPDGAESAGAYCILRFYGGDDVGDGDYVRTQDGALNWINGEKLFLTGPQVTTNYVKPGGVVEVIKTPTDYILRLYEYDPVTTIARPLGYYDPDEEVPMYRRSIIPGLENVLTCETTTITVLAKKNYIPVSDDEDTLLIQSMGAIKLGAQALMKENKDLIAEAEAYWAKAKAVLNEELDDYQGKGTVIPVRIVNSQFGFGAIPSLR